MEARAEKMVEQHVPEREAVGTCAVSSQTHKPRSYASAMRNEREPEESKKYKLFVKSKNNESAEAVRVILKRNINPTELKVGIRSLKALRDGRLIIEAGCKSEIDILSRKIEEQCSQHLEVNTPSLRKPNLIIRNIPEEVTVENASAIILSQNSELNLNEEVIKPKFIFKNKKSVSNLVVEVNSETRRLLVQRKLKLGWHICKIDDYVKVNRCYRCSKYRHKAENCNGQLTCPLCAGQHKLQDCKAEEKDFKCINCITFNTYAKKGKVHENHSSLNKNCPCLQSQIERYKQNTDY